MLISAGQFVAVGQATETDLAQALFYPKVIAIGQVTETDGAWMLHHVGIAEFPPPALLAEMAKTYIQAGISGEIRG